MLPKKILIISALTFGLMGCVVYPNVTTNYSEKCKTEKKKIELSIEQVGDFKMRNCSGDHDCKAQFVSQLAGAAILLPVSAIVSGSIALVGNTMYWLQEQSCSTS